MKAIVSNISGWSWVNRPMKSIDELELDKNNLTQLEVLSASVTLNDMHFLRNEVSKINTKPGLIMGHEAVAKISHIPPKLKIHAENKNLFVGSRVVFYPFFPCNECEKCKSGLLINCTNQKRMGLDVHGVYSNFIQVPMDILFPVPDSVDNPHALYLETIATALAACEDERILNCREIAIVGSGQVALLLTDIISHKLKSRKDAHPQVSVRNISPNFISSHPNRFDGIIEAWSDPSIADGMIHALRRGGTLLMKKRPSRNRLWSETKAREKNIYLRQSPDPSYEKALSWMASQSELLSQFNSAGFEFSSKGLQGMFDTEPSREKIGKMYFDFSAIS